MASLARELRARFVASPGARSVQGGSGHQAVERFGMSARGRGTAGEGKLICLEVLEGLSQREGMAQADHTEDIRGGRGNPKKLLWVDIQGPI